MQDQWTRWEPTKNLSEKYDIIAIQDTDGLVVELTDFRSKKNNVRVTFKDFVGTYRCTDETFRLRTIHKLGEQYGDSFYGDWTFFKVINSTYAKWISEESYGISDTRDLIHFSFITANFILDVIAASEPTVELIQK